MFRADTTSLTHLGEEIYVHASACDSELGVKIEIGGERSKADPDFCSRLARDRAE
jgi:hypothetical protein